jgi:hypothetical protein
MFTLKLYQEHRCLLAPVASVTCRQTNGAHSGARALSERGMLDLRGIAVEEIATFCKSMTSHRSSRNSRKCLDM